MSEVLFVTNEGSADELRIEVANRSVKPFTLECNHDRRGNRVYLELPRSYQTVKGAKSAAARIAGSGLEWRSAIASQSE
jgi:hypothetical protein